MFGKHPSGAPVEAENLCVRAPSIVTVRLPADLVAGCELVATGRLHDPTGREGSVQLQVSAAAPETTESLRPDVPILVAEGSETRRQIETAFGEFRRWFPLGLCYSKIVPVDEAVTLTLFHREDEPLVRLLLVDVNRGVGCPTSED